MGYVKRTHTDLIDPSETNASTPPRHNSLAAAMAIPGAVAAAIVDIESGIPLAQAGGPYAFDAASSGNAAVVRAKLRVLQDLGLADTVHDILITLGRQYHVIRPLRSPDGEGLFFYLVLDRETANLAFARHRLSEIDREFTLWCLADPEATVSGGVEAHP